MDNFKAAVIVPEIIHVFRFAALSKSRLGQRIFIPRPNVGRTQNLKRKTQNLNGQFWMSCYDAKHPELYDLERVHFSVEVTMPRLYSDGTAFD